jgi:hypothetical protein
MYRLESIILRKKECVKYFDDRIKNFVKEGNQRDFL